VEAMLELVGQQIVPSPSIVASPSIELRVWLGEARERAMVDCSVRFSSQFTTPMFFFCRHAKAHPDLMTASPEAALQLLKECWLDDDNTLAAICGHDDEEAAELEFLHAWEKSLLPVGFDIIAHAKQSAEARPVTPLRYRNAKYARFIAFVAALQGLVGDRTIILPRHSLAPKLGTDRSTLQRMVEFAVADGLLERRAKGRVSAEVRMRKADEFRFVGRFDETGAQLYPVGPIATHGEMHAGG
jgi:hypothetical protein